MKHYKLLKDLPTFKAGDEFETSNRGDLVFVRGTEEPKDGKTLVAYAGSTLEKFPNILTDWFEEIEESKNERWRAKENGEYYFVDDWGDVDYNYDAGFRPNNFRYDIGNYFKTEEEAKACKEYLLAKQVLLDDAKGGKWAKDGDNWYVYYNYDFDRWMTHRDKFSNLQIIGVIYFRSEKNAVKSLKEHKEQWDIVRGYETGEWNEK